MRWMMLALLGCAVESPEPQRWSADAPLAAPPADLPTTVSTLTAGGEARITVQGVVPDDEVYILLSTTGDGPPACPAALGECLGLAEPVHVLGRADERGEGWASLTFRTPPDVPRGQYVWVQAVARADAGTDWLGPVTADRVERKMCGAVWDPVCAVNGATYSNNCLALLEGWPVAYPGPC